LARPESHWDKVVDFRWHKSTASPNWRIIPNTDRKPAPIIVFDEKGGHVELAIPGSTVSEEEDEL